MDAIGTHYFGATNYRSSRIKASTLGNHKASVTVDYDHALSIIDNHRAAARALLEKVGWVGVTFVPGSTRSGYVFVGAYHRDDDIRVAG